MVTFIQNSPTVLGYPANVSVKNNSNVNLIQNPNVYNYVLAYAQSRSSDPSIVASLVQIYSTIAKNLGIDPTQFIQQVQAQGNTVQQDLYLAYYYNSVRAKNALIGVTGSLNTPYFIAREVNP